MKQSAVDLDNLSDRYIFGEIRIITEEVVVLDIFLNGMNRENITFFIGNFCPNIACAEFGSFCIEEERKVCFSACIECMNAICDHLRSCMIGMREIEPYDVCSVFVEGNEFFLIRSCRSDGCYDFCAFLRCLHRER